nr:MAG: hypothetical protein DIU62_10410 [Pseudomonadota bacterium]
MRDLRKVNPGPRPQAEQGRTPQPDPNRKPHPPKGRSPGPDRTPAPERRVKPRKGHPRATPRHARPPLPDAHDAERVQKILARAGLASRREAEEWIRAGRVTINGEVATLGSRARGTDLLKLDGRLIHRAPLRRSATWLCHRSPGEFLLPPQEGEAAGEARESIAARLPRRVGRRYIPVSPMPRGDGGLEILTSDGELAARLQRAVHELPVEFSVRVRGGLTAEQVEGVLRGRLHDGARLRVEECEPAGAGEGANHWYRVRAIGASGRELRELVEQQGGTVSRVLRVALGGIRLERSLQRGHVRQLGEAEVDQLLGPAPHAAPERS